MYSVILPTMWRATELAVMLPSLLDHPLVGEFIIIDNCAERCPPGAKRYLTHSKVVHVNQNKNIFVNPAWNLGAAISKYEKLCILSDDVLFHPDLLTHLDSHITENLGVFGPHPETINYPILPDKKIRNRVPKLSPGDTIPMIGFGMVMFLHKAAYLPIPDQFKIFFGDVWLTAHNALKRQVPNCHITEIDMLSFIRRTSASTEFKNTHEAEHSIVEGIFDVQFGNGIFRKRDEMFRNNLWWKEERKRRGLPESATFLATK